VRHLLLGGGGLLGSGFREVLAAQGADVVRLRPDWRDPVALGPALEQQLVAGLSAPGPVTVVWAAGVGHVGASADDMLAETTAVRALRAALQRAGSPDVTVLFASSAGALFAGHGDGLIDPGSTPTPVSPYGRAKLDQEGLLAEVADAVGCRIVLTRISNLYGLTGGRLTSRGLIATAVRATRLRQPMTVYVRQDTRRDYVYARDAAALGLRAAAAAPPGASTALVCDGSTRSVAQVLGVVRSVCGRKVPAVFAERPETRLQPYVLRFAAPAPSPDDVLRTPMEAAVHRMVHAPLAR